MITDSHRGTMVNSLTANDQINHATWTGSSQVPMCEERFTYDQNLNITRRQTWVNEVMESEAHQRQQHGRVTSREYKEWQHSTHRINPHSGMPESGKFVKVIRDEHTTWKYDINGHLVEKAVDKGGYRPLLWRYRWDARSQLTGLETPEGERWEYKYDPFGRRISKRCTNRDKPGMDFHWNGDQLTEEIPVSPDGTPDYENGIRWIYEPGSFTPLARYKKGQLHYTLTDTVGRIQELVTEDGTIVWRGRQQLWGLEEGRNKEDAPTCRLRFSGQYEDTESGLYYNRFRYYDCETGQYICADPIGLRGGLNPYGYVNNSLNYIDPLGLASECCPNAQQRRYITDLRNGKDVVVGSVDEARKLLDFMPELRPHVDKFPANSGYLFKDTPFDDVWKQPKGTYRGDLYNTKDPFSDVVHDSDNILHDTNPHYNILLPDGSKAGIIIAP